MAALQWLVLFAQRNANIFGLKPFRTIFALKAARFGAFAAALACAFLLGQVKDAKHSDAWGVVCSSFPRPAVYFTPVRAGQP